MQAQRDGSKTPRQQAAEFLARGFLINASMAIGLESELSPDEWTAICSKSQIARVDDLLDAAGTAR
jgi:hypothetical protein